MISEQKPDIFKNGQKLHPGEQRGNVVGSPNLQYPHKSQKTINYNRLPELEMQYLANSNFPVIQKGVKDYTKPRVHRSKEKSLAELSDYMAKKGFVNQSDFAQKNGYNRRNLLQQSQNSLAQLSQENKLKYDYNKFNRDNR